MSLSESEIRVLIQNLKCPDHGSNINFSLTPKIEIHIYQNKPEVIINSKDVCCIRFSLIIREKVDLALKSSFEQG